jgi:hypothetical protein
MSNARNNAAKLLGDITATSINAGPLTGFRNRIINGTGLINQRSSSGITTNATYFLDRWETDTSLAATGNVIWNFADDYSTSVVGARHMYMQTQVAKITLAVGDYATLNQQIEGLNVIDLLLGKANAKAFTVSFRAATTTPATMSVSFRNASDTRSYVTTVNVTTTPTTFTITVPGDTTGTWGTGTGMGIVVGFAFAAASNGTFTTSTLNAWQAGNFIAANTQTNCLDTLNRYINIADVQLEKGTTATPFEIRSYGAELALCQRYFNALQGDFPAYFNTATDAFIMFSYPPMRVTPTGSTVGNVANCVVNRASNSGTAITSVTNIYTDSNTTGLLRVTIPVPSSTGFGSLALLTNDFKFYLAAEL